MGYDIDLFVEKELCERLICPICSDVLSNPAECKKCQNPFCTDCVIGWQKKNQSCPLCQDSPFEWKQSRFIKNLIEDLKIRCQVAGCEEVIKLGQKEQHQQVCKALKVSCSNAINGCTYSGIRGSLESHEQQCEFRLTLCIECQDLFLLSEQKNHNCIQSLKQEIRSLKIGFIQYQKKALKAVQQISQNLQSQAQPLLFQEVKEQGQHDYALNFTPFQIPGKLDYDVVQKSQRFRAKYTKYRNLRLTFEYCFKVAKRLKHSSLNRRATVVIKQASKIQNLSQLGRKLGDQRHIHLLDMMLSQQSRHSNRRRL